ncbi:MAG TPA: TIM-barrel domain-containing protein [Acidobacteriaceae bacterium]|nr:TIM-barrel domain-containing protein [Acidobacteriaceae bacterium]
MNMFVMQLLQITRHIVIVGIKHFVYGSQMDQLVHQYRSLTGHTPMLPRWAYGFFQSKDRYKSTEELLEIANRYRAEHIPLDAVVQDWYRWAQQGDPG